MDSILISSLGRPKKYNGTSQVAYFVLYCGGIPVIATIAVLVLVLVFSLFFTRITKLHSYLPFDIVFHKRLLYRPFSNKILKLLNPILSVTYGEILLVSIHFTMNLVWFFFHNIENFTLIGFDYGEITNAFGRIALYNYLFVLFPAHRISVITFFFGVGFENSLKYHKILGKLVFLFGFTHSILWAFKSTHDGWYQHIFKWTKPLGSLLPGFISILGFATMFILSIERVRTISYSFFYYTHIISTTVATIFLIFHRNTTTLLILSGAIILTLFDFLWRFISGYIFTSRIVDYEVYEKKKLLKLVIEKWGFPRYKPGHFIYFWKSSSFVLSHPFTISSTPYEFDDSPKKFDWKKRRKFTIHVKSRGNYTNKLYQEAKKNQLMQTKEKFWSDSITRISGPYGTRWDYEKYKNVVLIADGGFGFVPIGILKDIHYRNLDYIKVHFVWDLHGGGYDYIQICFTDLNVLIHNDNINMYFFIGKNRSRVKKTSGKGKSLEDESEPLLQIELRNEEKKLNTPHQEKTLLINKCEIEDEPDIKDLIEMATTNKGKVTVGIFGAENFVDEMKRKCFSCRKRIHLYTPTHKW